MDASQNSASDVVRLITEIVVLVTAIIGTYKVATSKPEIAGTAAKAEKREWPDLVKMLGTYFGIYVFMFVPMIFMLLISWVTRLMGSNSDHSRTPKPLPTEFKIGVDPSRLSEQGVLALRMFQAGTAMGSEPERSKVLTRAVQLSIQSNDLQVSLVAAQAIEDQPVKDEELRQVMRSATRSGALEIAVSAISSMSSSPEKDDAGNELAASIENWSKHLQSSPH